MRSERSRAQRNRTAGREGNRRGDEAEERVVEVLRRLPEVVEVERSPKFGKKDRRGVDITVTTRDPQGRRHVHELQVKSSEQGVAEHRARPGQTIPVVNGGWYEERNGTKRQVPEEGIKADFLNQITRRKL